MLRYLRHENSRFLHHDNDTEGTAPYRLQNSGTNVRLPSLAAVCGDQDNRPHWVKLGPNRMSALSPLNSQ
jgi:hypothetical protein